MQAWLLAYALTCAIEIPIVVWALRTLGWWPGWGRALALAWALQLTHPILWLVNPPTFGAVLAAEVVIVLVEGAALALWAGHGLRVRGPSRPSFLGHLRDRSLRETPTDVRDPSRPSFLGDRSLRGRTWRLALLVSLLANSVSLAVGLVSLPLAAS